MDHGHSLFDIPTDSQYDLDMEPIGNDFDLEFDETTNIDSSTGILAPAGIQHHQGAQRSRVNPPSRLPPSRMQPQKGVQHLHKRTFQPLRTGTTTQSSGAKTLPKAQHVLHQFGQAAHRLRAMDERITSIEKWSTQLHEMSRRLTTMEQRLSEVQIGLKTAEEGHEEISEMVKASLSFLDDLNADQSIGEQPLNL